MTQDSPPAPALVDQDAPAAADPALADPALVDPVEVCFDSGDLRLSRAGVTVRRTLEGADRGWSLEFPADVRESAASSGRLRWPLGENPQPVPVALLGLVRARLRGRPLEPIVLPTDSGEFGAPEPEDPNPLARLVGELVDLDARVRLNRADSTEQAWVLVRRLAVGLAVFADDAALSFELEWLAQVLATAREGRLIGEQLPVQLERMAAALVDDGVSEAVRRRVGRELDRRQRQSRVSLIRALNSSRYLALLDALDDFVALHPSWPASELLPVPEISDPGPAVDPEPEVDPEAARAAELAQLAARSHRRMLKALADRPTENPVKPVHLAQFDRMLLAVERSRCATEALTQRPARRYTARVRKLQRLLQDRRDQLLIQEALVGLSEKARRAGEDAFDYGRLHAQLDRVLAERDHLGRTFEARLDDAIARVERRGTLLPSYSR